MTDSDYGARCEAEQQSYKDQTNVHDLPPICFYWLNRHILPQMASLGVASGDDFFVSNLHNAYGRSIQPIRRFVSIGAGNCDTEMRLAQSLRSAGVEDFTIDCLDLNDDM